MYYRIKNKHNIFCHVQDMRSPRINGRVTDHTKMPPIRGRLKRQSTKTYAGNDETRNDQQWRIQDFREGRANPSRAPKCYLTCFFRKLHENEKKLAHTGVRVPRAPLRSATDQD